MKLQFKYANKIHTLRNIHRRWQNLAKHHIHQAEEESGIKQTLKNNWLLQEIDEINQIVQGKKKISRVLQCGSCKFPVDAEGTVKMIEDAQIERIFECPECHKTIKVDYNTMPSYRALKH